MPAIIDQAGRQFNVDEADGVSRRHRWHMARLVLTTLGGFHARLDGGGPVPLPTRKTRALLAYLALSAGQPHPRDKLAALLWGNMREAEARHGLRQALSAIRKALADAAPRVLSLCGETIAVAPAVVDVDAAAFERAVTERTPEALQEAIALYQGDLLAGLTLKEPPFEEWLLAERERLREIALEALGRLLNHQSRAGTTEAAVRTALRLSAFDPLQEAVHRTLMRLYVQLGRREAALRQYQRCVCTLERELGVAPDRETTDLYNEILQQRASRDSRTSRLPVASPEWPSPRATPSEARPAEIPLIGRGREMAQLHAALNEAWGGHGQLLALLGEAGIGKSRLVADLGTEVARQGGRVLVGHAYETGQNLPLALWVDTFRTGQVTRDPSALSGLPPVWRAGLARLFPELGESIVRREVRVADPLVLFEGVEQLLGRLAVQQPLLLILEDLEWADELSLQLLAFLGHRLPPWRILAVATASVEALAESPILRRTLDDLDRTQPRHRLILQPLSQTETSALVRALVPTERRALAEIRLGEQVWVASEGNPFIVVELLRALEKAPIPHTSIRLPLPSRVHEFVGRRLERLGMESRRLVAVAAVIGRTFDFGLLQRAAGLAEAEVVNGVEDLVRHGVLEAVGDCFAFTHGWLRDVAYAQLLPPRLAVLRHAVAAARATLSSGSRDTA